MKKLLFICLIIMTIACEKDNTILISDLVSPDRYYDTEIFSEQNLKIYGKWEFLYKFGGIGGSYYDPAYDFLEIVRYGIYGMIYNDEIKQLGQLNIVKQDNNETIIDFLPDDKYKTDYFLIQKIVVFNGNDTLILIDNMCDGYGDYYKRIK